MSKDIQIKSKIQNIEYVNNCCFKLNTCLEFNALAHNVGHRQTTNISIKNQKKGKQRWLEEMLRYSSRCICICLSAHRNKCVSFACICVRVCVCVLLIYYADSD